MAGKPCSRKSAARAASRTAPSTFRLRASSSTSESSTPPASSTRRRPSPSRSATSAQLCLETMWERNRANWPSSDSGCSAKIALATASSSTLSPRNSSRSYDSARSSAQDGCVNTCRRRFGGSSSIRRSCSAPLALLVRCDVIDCLPDRLDLLGLFVRDLDVEPVFELHDQLDEVEGGCVEVLLEGGVLCHLALVDTQLIDEDFLDSSGNFLTRRGHCTSLDGRENGARMLPRSSARLAAIGWPAA